MNQIVFLTYIPRSGSTYLAKLLDEYKDIGVTIEANIPDGIRNGKCKIENYNDFEEYLERLYRDEKFNYWNIDKDRLKKILMNHSFPIKFNTILPVILNEYFKNREVKIWIFKSGYYIEYIQYLKGLFPNAKFLYVIRDPRAIYCSQRNTMNRKTKKPFTASVFPVAKRFNRINDILKNYYNEEWFYISKYENLIRNTEHEIKDILKFLGVKNKIKHQMSNYFEKIPENQKSLHPNINWKSREINVNKWREKISMTEILLIQHIAGKSMEEQGYPLIIKKGSSWGIIHGYLWQGYLYISNGVKNKLFNLYKKLFRQYSAKQNRI